MKTKTTKKYLLANYGNIICVGYCNVQTMLSCASPVYYLTRSEGWAADIYVIDNNTVIATGYAPFGNIKPAYDLQRKYENAARAARADYENDFNYDKLNSQLNDLVKDFVLESLIMDTLTKREYETIKDNLTAFANNFGWPVLKRADYGRGLYVYWPDTETDYIQYCYDISYFDGWLYGVVQGVHRFSPCYLGGGENER